MKVKRLMTFSGAPVKRARSSSSWVQTPTGQVLEWHWRTMMQPMAIRLAVPMPNSSAPNIAAMTMSRPVRMPPSARSRTEWRRLLSVRTWLASDSPISHGPPANFTEVCGAGAGAADVAGDQDHVRLGLGDASGDGADAGHGDQLHGDHGVGIDLLQVVDELGEVLDGIDVVVRRRGDQHHARRGVAQLGDQFGDLEAGQLAAFSRLRALGDLDLDLAALVEIFGRHAEAA
jgi:hypothetical protein